MMRLFVLAIPVAVAFALSSAAAGPMPAPANLPTPAPHVAFTGGDGSSCDAAVVIAAKNEPEGIRAQRWWAFTKNPGAMVEGQSVSSKGGKDLETFTLIMPDGSRKTICFDITSFFGKF